jgi:hypothetical protein
MGILSPRGEGKYYDLLFRTFLMMVFTNIPLALWGEGVLRTGEGLFLRLNLNSRRVWFPMNRDLST